MKQVLFLILVFLFSFTSCKKDASNPVNTNTVPSPPTLATPKDTTYNVVVPVVLTWNESSNATGYTLQVSTSSSFSSFIFNKSDITTTTQQIPDTNYLKIYYWRVNASNSSGTSDWSKVWSFTTTGEAAFVPALYQPYNGAVGQKIAPNLIWNPVGNNSRYTLQISSNSSFTNLVFNADSLIENSINITSLSGSTKYYWHVKADNNFGSKGWSETWSFTTGVAPTPPVLLSPSDGATDISLSPTLTWSASNGATSYNLQVATDNSFSSSSLVLNQNVGNTTYKQLSGLSNSKTYFWKIAVVNSYGTSGWSTVWSFTATGPFPMVPVLSYPIDGTINYSAPLTLSWLATSGATSYTLQVSGNSSFTNFVYNQSGLTSSNQQVTGLTASTYYWRVSASDNYGTSGWSTVWSVTTAAPIAPDLSSPVNGATNISLSPILNWSASGGATSYTLQVSVNSSFTSFVYNQSGLTSLSQQVTGLTAPNKYYWRVSSTNGYGTSGWSYTWSFTVS